MSRWNAEFENHKVVAGIQDALQVLESFNTEGLTADQVAEFGRLLKVMKFLGENFATLDPELCPVIVFSQAAGALSNLRSNVQAYVQNRALGNLNAANQQADTLLTFWRSCDSGMGPENGRAIIEANTVLHKKIVQDLQSRAGEVKAQMGALSTEIANTKIRSQENDAVIQKQKARLDDSIAEFQKQFSKSQESRVVEYAKVLKDFAETFAKGMEDFQTRLKTTEVAEKTALDAIISNTHGVSEQHLRFLQEREDEVNKIFGVIGTSAFAGNFKITADADGNAANRWRLTAILLMGAIGVFAIVAFVYSIANPKDWEMFLFRLGTCLFLAVPAFYAANESSKHRERERLNRKLHLELTAIDAYLVLLPDTQRNDIKAKLSERFFGVPELKENAEPVTKKDIFGLVETFVSNMSKGK